MFYTVIGFQFDQFDQDNNYYPACDEDVGNATLIDDASLSVIYNDDCSQCDHCQRLLRVTNPPDVAQAQLRNLVYTNSDGEVEDSEEEDAVDDAEDYGQEMNLRQGINFQQASEQEHGTENLEQDH
jgi:hypothetical protein